MTCGCQAAADGLGKSARHRLLTVLFMPQPDAHSAAMGADNMCVLCNVPATT